MRSLQLLALTLGLSSMALAQEPTLVAHYRLDETAGPSSPTRRGKEETLSCKAAISSGP